MKKMLREFQRGFRPSEFALHSDDQDTLGGGEVVIRSQRGDVRSTVESLGAYLFAGAFRFIFSLPLYETKSAEVQRESQPKEIGGKPAGCAATIGRWVTAF